MLTFPENELQAVFFDRDGVIWRDVPYLHRWADVQFEPGVFAFARAVHQLGAKLIVITNQSGVGRGKYTEAEVVALHRTLSQRFAQEGCPLTDLRYAPHHPEYDSNSVTRKPEALLFEQSCARHRLDPARCIAIGDRQRDLSPAKALGMTTIAYQP
ncbi:MAG: D-glycero-alpha-D-manno-heptose-1,7-bisphosphate 7-phosphatase, partial [Bacteroidota bacterium]